jgi:hypothetical protein
MKNNLGCGEGWCHVPIQTEPFCCRSPFALEKLTNILFPSLPIKPSLKSNLSLAPPPTSLSSFPSFPSSPAPPSSPRFFFYFDLFVIIILEMNPVKHFFHIWPVWVVPIRLTRLMMESRQFTWRDSRGWRVNGGRRGAMWAGTTESRHSRRRDWKTRHLVTRVHQSRHLLWHDSVAPIRLAWLVHK